MTPTVFNKTDEYSIHRDGTDERFSCRYLHTIDGGERALHVFLLFKPTEVIASVRDGSTVLRQLILVLAKNTYPRLFDGVPGEITFAYFFGYPDERQREVLFSQLDRLGRGEVEHIQPDGPSDQVDLHEP